MIFVTGTGESFDTEKDLTAPERHILQKLFIWERMAETLEQFKEKRDEALRKGWNNSGPVSGGRGLTLIVKDLEKKVAARLAGS